MNFSKLFFVLVKEFTMIIFIRHSLDNDLKHRINTKLTTRGKRIAYIKGLKLIRKYGVPYKIYCSPFRRTIQTMKSMLKSLPKESLPKIKLSHGLSRYFSSKELMQDFTLSIDVPVHETKEEFTQRVVETIKKLQKWVHSQEVVWCITHTTVIKKIAKIYKIKLPHTIPFMYSFVVG